MHWCFLFVTICCVKYSWCIYNIDRYKGLPLIKTTTEPVETVIGNKREVFPFAVAEESIGDINSNKLKNYNGVVITKTPLAIHNRPVTVDEQTIDAFNHLPSKKISAKEDQSAMAIFFEKMSMFQMIMQASLEAIVSRVTNLESSLAGKTEDGSDHGHGRKYGKEISEKKETQLESVQNSRLTDVVETINSPGPVSELKDGDCVEDPNIEDEAPEKFNVGKFVDDESNLRKREAYYDGDDDTSKSDLKYKASVDDEDLLVSHRNNNYIGNNLSSSSKPKKIHFKTKSHKVGMKERKMPPTKEKVVINFKGHEEESLLDSYQSSINDISNDPSQKSNISYEPLFAHQESFDFAEKDQFFDSPPQTRNKIQLLNRTAFENDRSRANPRLEYQIMKLQRRSDHQMAPKGSDYDCLDDDGIDCLEASEAEGNDDDKARKLDELTRRDNFQARTSSNEVFDIDVELINIERAEKKLEELIRQTAMIGELEDVLKILNNFKPGCPYNVPSVKVGELCYSVEFTHLTFKEARRFCKARGGTLAQEPLNGYIWSQISKAYPEHEAKDMWVGAYDERGEGRFLFFDGGEISSSDNRWESNSPSYSGHPNCLSVHAKTGLSFKDYNCDKKQHFICEYRLTSFI